MAMRLQDKLKLSFKRTCKHSSRATISHVTEDNQWLSTMIVCRKCSQLIDVWLPSEDGALSPDATFYRFDPDGGMIDVTMDEPWRGFIPTKWIN